VNEAASGQRAKRIARKNMRFEVRVSPAQKALAQEAAMLQGRTLSEFVTASVQQAAEQTIRAHKVITLTADDSRAFAEALLAPPAPNARLRALAERYKDTTAP
jgi:uncharacterized protein (DUF1778 family)